MMRALIEGNADPDALAELAKGKLRIKLPALEKTLTGRFEDHHAFLLERMLAHIEELEADIDAVSQRIEEEIRPFERALELLDTIPGVDRRAAEVIVSETGADMSRFPTAAHLASWAGICPGQNESAGKRKSGKTRRGSKWLRMTLIESARAASRSKGTHLGERYRQLARRRGDKKAIIAIAHEDGRCWARNVTYPRPPPRLPTWPRVFRRSAPPTTAEPARALVRPQSRTASRARHGPRARSRAS